MKQIAFRGGEIALKLIRKSSFSLKPDNSVLTKVDTEISAIARSVLKDILAKPDHILIDEEDIENTRYLDQSYLEATRFIWVLDPIDGTRAFSNRMPNFGISIGLLKDLKPWLGVIYFPMLGELFYSEGKQSIFVRNAFTKSKIKTVITPIDQQITSQSIFICNDSFSEKFDWDYSDCQLMNPACAVLGLCWPSIGRGCGAFFGAHIWDFAGSWPIFLSADLSLRSYQTGNEMSQLDIGLFFGKSKNPWRLREWYILSSERNFSLLREKITPKYQK
ncbi:MAG: inositol monophosphatase family protein [Candidatus Anammoxibacter sp.]